jgi:hypothetical protein
MSEDNRHPSGEHPIVVKFREKLQSIEEHDVPTVEDLNRRILAYLDEIKTPVPPAPDSEDTTAPGA